MDVNEELKFFCANFRKKIGGGRFLGEAGAFVKIKKKLAGGGFGSVCGGVVSGCM